MKSKWLGLFSLSLFVLISIPFVFADIDLTEPAEEYFIGEYINVTASVDHDEDEYGFFRMSLVCPGDKSTYFMIPLLVKDGSTATVTPEPFRITDSNAEPNDDCYLLAEFLDDGDNVILDERTDTFEIVSDFDVDITLQKTTFDPGEVVEATILIDIPEDAFSDISLDLVVDKQLSRYSSEQKNFTINYTLPRTVTSGEQEIVFQIEDEYGNDVDESITITINSRPSSLKNLYSETTYDIDDEFSFKPILYDQGNQILDDKTIEVRLIGPDGEEITSSNVLSTLRFTYAFDISLKPGSYKVISKYDDLQEITSFTLDNVEYVAPVEENNDVKSDQEENAEPLDPVVADLIEESDKKEFNPWKWVAYFLVLVILLYAAFVYGRHTILEKGKEKKNKNKPLKN